MKKLIVCAFTLACAGAALCESANNYAAYSLGKSVPISVHALPERPVFELNRRIWQSLAECYVEVSLPIVVSNTIYYALKDSSANYFSASPFSNSSDYYHVFSSMGVCTYGEESWKCISFDVQNWASRFSARSNTVTVWYIVDDNGKILNSNYQYRTDLVHIALGYFTKVGDGVWMYDDALEQTLLYYTGLSVAIPNDLLGDGEHVEHWTYANGERFIIRPQWVCAGSNTNLFLLSGEWRNAITIVDKDGYTTKTCMIDMNTYSNMYTTCEKSFVSTYNLTSTNFTAEAARQFVLEYRQVGPRMRMGTVVRIR